MGMGGEEEKRRGRVRVIVMMRERLYRTALVSDERGEEKSGEKKRQKKRRGEK
jgi:hypothetical protein